MIEGYMTTKEAAKYLKCSDAYIRKLCETKRLDGAVKAGNTWLIPEESIKRYKPGPRGFAGLWERVRKEQARIKKAKALEGSREHEYTPEIGSTPALCAER